MAQLGHHAARDSADRACTEHDPSGRRGKRILPTFAKAWQTRRPTAGKARHQHHDRCQVEKVDEIGVIADGKRIRGDSAVDRSVAPSPIVNCLRQDDRAAGCRSPFHECSDVSNVFVVGDTSSIASDGRPVPGVAQAAIQQGRYVGRLIARQLVGREPKHPFRYFDKGNMAVVGKNFAILESGRLRVNGFVTWLVWVFLHLMSLRNCRTVAGANPMFWSYFTGQRGARLIPEPPRPEPTSLASERSWRHKIPPSFLSRALQGCDRGLTHCVNLAHSASPGRASRLSRRVQAAKTVQLFIDEASKRTSTSRT